MRYNSLLTEYDVDREFRWFKWVNRRFISCWRIWIDNMWSDGAEICDEMWFWGLISNTCKWHFISWDIFSWVGDVHPKMFLGPGNSWTFHGFAITKSSCSCLTTNNTIERRSCCTFTITLHINQCTSIAWQTLHWSSKIPFPMLASPGGTVTSGSLNPPFFFPINKFL